MKRKILLLVLIAFNLTAVYCQQQGLVGSVFSTGTQGNAFTQKIEFDNGNQIILSKTLNFYEFCDIVNQRSAKIYTSLKINDFKVFEDYVYFCGDYGNNGFIAKASMVNLFTNSYYELAVIPEMPFIEKMQVYKDANLQTHIACIGLDTIGYSCLIDCIANTTAAYTIYKTPINSNENFDDIVQNHDKIFIVSRTDIVPTTNFIVRSFEKSNYMIQDKGLYNNGTGWRYTRELILDTIPNDGVIVVGEATDLNDDDWITIAILVPHIGVSGFSHSYGNPNHVDSLGNHEIRYIRDLAYYPETRKLYVLEEHPYSLQNPTVIPYSQMISSIVELDFTIPIGQSYISNIYYSNINGIDHKFNSIKFLPHSPRFIMAGWNPLNSQVEYFHGVVNTTGGNCNVLDYHRLAVRPADKELSPNSIHIYLSNTAVWTQEKASIGNISNQIICN